MNPQSAPRVRTLLVTLVITSARQLCSRPVRRHASSAFQRHRSRRDSRPRSGRFVAFYEKLGFEQAFDLRKNDVPYESFIKINDNQFIELYPDYRARPESRDFFISALKASTSMRSMTTISSRGLTPTAVRKAGAGNLLFTMAGPHAAVRPAEHRVHPVHAGLAPHRTTRGNTSARTGWRRS